jgi:hypothetical protein
VTRRRGPATPIEAKSHPESSTERSLAGQSAARAAGGARPSGYNRGAAVIRMVRGPRACRVTVSKTPGLRLAQ